MNDVLVKKAVQGYRKNLDLKERQVAFYFFIFDEVDLQGDFVDKDIDVKVYPHAKWFLNHNVEQLLGRIIEISKDSTGVYAICEFANTSTANDIYELYKMGAITQHSVGFYVKKSEQTKKGTLIKAIELMEVSTLTHFAAQPLATTIAVKNYKQNNTHNNSNNMKNERNKVHHQHPNPKRNETPIEMKIKATEQEVAALQESMNSLTTSVANLNNVVTELVAKYGNQSQDTTEQDMQEASKNLGSVVHDVATKNVQSRFSTRELFKLKAISFSGAGAVSSGGTFYNSIGLKRNILEVFKKEYVRTNNVLWSGITAHTAASGNNSPNCYTPNLSDISVQHVTTTLNRVVAVTDYCMYLIDTVENEQDFWNEIGFLLFGEVESKIAASVYNQLTTNGTPQTAVPSWTALAGSIADTTLVDILHVHSTDIHALSGGKLNPLSAVCVINPIDYSRLFTDKTATYRDILTDRQIAERFIPCLSVPAGDYVILPNQYLTLFLLGTTNIKKASGAGLQAFSGVEYVGFELHYGVSLTATINNNVVIYGNIAAAITNY